MSEEHQEFIERCLAIYDELEADWLPLAELRAMLAQRDAGITYGGIVRRMRDYGEETTTREYNSRNLKGFVRGQFVRTQQSKRTEEAEIQQEAHGHDLEECASLLLNWIADRAPDWRMLIEVLQVQRGFDAKTTIASLMSYTLENRLHMVVPKYDVFDQPGWSPEPQECPVCKETYSMSYPGQKTCLNSQCGRIFHGQVVEDEQAELVAMAEPGDA